MSSDYRQLFVSCASELEVLLQEELKELGISQTHVGYRGVYIEEWDWNTVYRVNYSSRLASRVLLPLSRFKCRDQRSLYRHVSEMNWSALFKQGYTFAIDANVHHKELRNSLYAAQVMKDAICDQLRERSGWRPSVDVQNPDVQLNLFIQQQMAVVSFDTSGSPLHKRGYRQETGEAPIQESLAAALLRLAKYDESKILLDPCCGSGTILVEAALIASKTAPGYLRHQWGFMKHPQFNSLEWLKIKNEIDSERIKIKPDSIFGIDISREMTRIAKVNLKAAGFNQDVFIEQSDFREYDPLTKPNLIVTNPPHGRRLEEEEQLRSLYRELGVFIKTKTVKPAQGFIFTGNLALAKEVGLAASRRYVLNNGGVESRLLEFDVY